MALNEDGEVWSKIVAANSAWTEKDFFMTGIFGLNVADGSYIDAILLGDAVTKVEVAVFGTAQNYRGNHVQIVND